jgi:D-amino-acid dehydrogenase
VNEVVVVGAGMVGTATALALQERGYDVTLVDRSSPGRETSYGNAGIIQGEAHEPYAMPRDIKTLTRIVLKADNSVNWDARGLWRSGPSLLSYWRHSNPVKHQGVAVAYSQLIRRATHDHGELITASGAEELIRRDGFRSAFRDSRAFEAQLHNAARLRDLYGVEFDCEDSEALSAAEPALRKRLAGAIRWRDAWTCSDPGALVQAYAKLFARRGGKLLELEVRTLEQVASRWRLHTGEGTIDTAQIVIALGPWSPNLLATLGYKVRMVPKRGYHLNFRYASEGTTPRLDLPLLDTSIGAVYAPMRAGLRVATGADLSSFRDRVVPRQMLRAEAAVRELLDIGQPIETSVWNGVRPCMPDMMPVIGPAPRHRGLWLNFGHGHQGFTLGPTTGALLAEAMADGTTEAVPSIAAWRTFR